MALNLFAAAAEKQKDHLVEFRAGRMNMDPNTKIVRADKRKGLIQLKSEDGLIHFIWKDRSTNQIETELMIFKDDSVFRKVEEANGRVYVLEFKASNKKLFFWLQEPSSEKDEQYCNDINKYINNPPQPGGGGGSGGDKAGDLQGLDQNQLLQFLSNAQGTGNLNGLRELLQRSAGGIGGGSQTAQRRPVTTTATTTQSRTSASTGLSNLVSQNSNASSTATATASTSSATSRATNSTTIPPMSTANANALKNIVANFAKEKAEPQLMDIVNVDEIIKSGLLDNEEIVKKLVEYLPEGSNITKENIKDNLNSNQFKEAVRNFHIALKSGELATIAMSFGLDASSIGPNSTIEDFLLAIQKKANKENGESSLNTENK